MKVLLVIRSLGVGGAERQAITLARSLDEIGVNVHLATFYGGGPLEKELDPYPRVALHDLRKSGRWDIARFGIRLRRLLKREWFDAVYSFLPNANVVSLVARTIPHRPRIVWGVRSSYMDLARYSPVNRWNARVERLLARFADRIVFNSMAGMQMYTDRGYPEAKLRYVPNGIDSERFSFQADTEIAVREEFGFDADAPLIGLFARIDYMKDHRTFLAAADQLHQSDAAVRFVCVGGVNSNQEDYFSDLKRETTSRRLDGVIYWAGQRSMLERLMSACDITTLTSIGEGFPNVVAESMACEVPCVSTDVGDARMIIGEHGMVVEPSDPAALADAWGRLLALPRAERQDMGRRARKSVVERFSLRRCTEATLEALKGLPEHSGQGSGGA